MTDQEFLQELASDLEDIEWIEQAVRLRGIASQNGSQPQEVLVVEQRTAMKTAGAAPDGWQWDDLNPPKSKLFTGNFWGIRLQSGEPILEQNGNFLLFRQGHVSYTDRQDPIYSLLSSLPGVTVLVVFGFMGARDGLMLFRDGEMGPLRPAGELEETVRTWLRWAHENPQPGHKRKQPKRPPPPDQLPL